MTKEIINKQIEAVSVAYYKLPSVPALINAGWTINEALKFSLETNEIASKIQNAIFNVIFENFDKASLMVNDAFEKTFSMLNEIIRH